MNRNDNAKRLTGKGYEDGQVAAAFTELGKVLGAFKRGEKSEDHVVSAVNLLIEANVRKAADELREEWAARGR